MGVEIESGGLALIFKRGEMIPLKGIWFDVKNVGFDVLELKPRSTTAAFQKKKKSRR